MATALPILDIQEPGTDLAKKTVFIKVHLGLLWEPSRLVHPRSKWTPIRPNLGLETPADSPESKPLGSLDGDVRRYLYDTCWPFEVGIHLLPLGCWRRWMKSWAEVHGKRSVLVESVPRSLPPPVPRGRGATAHAP